MQASRNMLSAKYCHMKCKQALVFPTLQSARQQQILMQRVNWQYQHIRPVSVWHMQQLCYLQPDRAQ